MINRNVPTPIGYTPGFEPVWGFKGTGEQERLTMGDQQIFYVDSGHANANDDNLGTDSEYPLATIQELIDRSTGASTNVAAVLADYDIVYVSGTVAEDVTTGDYTEMPSYVQVIGVGPSGYSPAWEGADANTISLDLRCVGWRISNFRFYGKTGASCVELRHTDSGANDIAIRTVIDNCLFDGLTTGLRGIGTHGCYDVWIVDCTFQLWNNAGNTAVGIETLTTPLAIPYRNHLVNCVFWDSDNGAIFEQNGGEVVGCMFQPTGYAYAMVQVLNTSVVANPGDDNVVHGNTFPGDYSIAGGYRPGAADAWLGNWADDTAEAEVGDNGVTIARPT
jgi:hypothetical protein